MDWPHALHVQMFCWLIIPNPLLSANISTRPAANCATFNCFGLKGNPNTFNHIASSPAMVMDDEYVVERDLDNFVMGEVKDFSSINNLRVLLLNEGFSILLCKAQPDFVSRERIVWIDIEGVSLTTGRDLLSLKIGSRWGEVKELEETRRLFARKRICIKTKLEDNILRIGHVRVPISENEVRNAVWGCEENKSSEPDGWIVDDCNIVYFSTYLCFGELNKDVTVADKLQFSVTSSLRRSVRGGVESSQLALLQTYIEGTLLSNMEDSMVKIPRTCSSVADWLRISSGSYATLVESINGHPLVHHADLLNWVQFHQISSKVKDCRKDSLYNLVDRMDVS
ncbi:hypothetical protein Tco_0154791 [Tanacetum coccineum]